VAGLKSRLRSSAMARLFRKAAPGLGAALWSGRRLRARRRGAGRRTFCARRGDLRRNVRRNPLWHWPVDRPAWPSRRVRRKSPDLAVPASPGTFYARRGDLRRNVRRNPLRPRPIDHPAWPSRRVRRRCPDLAVPAGPGTFCARRGALRRNVRRNSLGPWLLNRPVRPPVRRRSPDLAVPEQDRRRLSVKLGGIGDIASQRPRGHGLLRGRGVEKCVREVVGRHPGFLSPLGSVEKRHAYEARPAGGGHPDAEDSPNVQFVHPLMAAYLCLAGNRNGDAAFCGQWLF
jgi:hypothetical protein